MAQEESTLLRCLQDAHGHLDRQGAHNVGKSDAYQEQIFPNSSCLLSSKCLMLVIHAKQSTDGQDTAPSSKAKPKSKICHPLLSRDVRQLSHSKHVSQSAEADTASAENAQGGV